MTNYITTTDNRVEPCLTRAGIGLVMLAMTLMFTQFAHAVPMTVNVYGAPYFSLADSPDKEGADKQWIVLGGGQDLLVSVEDDQLTMLDQHDLSVRDRTGHTDEFSFVSMFVSLPGSNALAPGFVDYLMGDVSGRFTLEQVVYRTPQSLDDSVFSLFFWGIDYVNGAALVLGLESNGSPGNYQAAAQVSEPSVLLLMLIGFSVLGLTSGRR